MTAVSREYALRIASERARTQADPQAESTAENIAHGFFDNVLEDGKFIERWRHKGDWLDMEIPKFSFNRADLRNNVVAYLEYAPWMQDRNLDWLAANQLAFAEFQGFVLSINPSLHLKRSAAATWTFYIIKWLWAITKWVLWILVAGAAFKASPWWAIVWLGLTLLVQVPKYRHKRRIARLVDAMLAVYSSISSPTLSWAVVWDLMAKSRDLGAVWDPELYRLVELRK